MNLSLYEINGVVRKSLAESLANTMKSKDSKISVTFILALNKKKTTSLLQSVDMFSQSKCIVEIEVYNTPLFEEKDFKKAYSVLLNTFANSPEYEVVLAIFHLG